MLDEKRTTTTEALLGMLSMGPMSGYELKQRIADSIGNFWSESYGQIYPALRALEVAGLVIEVEPNGAEGEAKGKAKHRTGGTVGGAGRRAGRRVYGLTEQGRERLEQWLSITPRPRVPRHETLLKLFLGENVAVGTSLAHVAELRRRFAADLERYAGVEAHLQQTYPGHAGLPYWLMTLRYGREEARMIVQWCEETTRILKQMEVETGRAARPKLVAF